MTSLYGRLFKYRAREARSPLEDYLTECLADLFNRLELSDQKSFVKEIFIPDKLGPQWDQFALSLESLRLETQYPIQGGRIDLVLFTDSNPLLAIENKITAPVAATGDGDNQLSTYGRWIKSSKQREFPPIVCFLSHITRPPKDFISGGDKSGGAIPHVVEWGEISAALVDLCEPSTNVSAEVCMLAAELYSFLGEKDMSREFAGEKEFAAAIVYLRAGTQMNHTFDTIFEHLKEIGGHFTSGVSIHDMSLHFETKDSLIWGWKYLGHPTLSGVFFGYGIALEPNVTFRAADVPTRNSVFLCVGADDRRSIHAIRTARETPRKPWTYVEMKDWTTVISFRSLHEFMADPQSFSLQMTAWIDESKEEVNAFVSELA